MAGRRKGDGRGRLGGRAAGTPNKTNAATKNAVARIVGDYLTPQAQAQAAGIKYTLDEDLSEMAPAERARLMASLAAYVIPKQQALSIEDQTRIEADALTQWLETAPAEAIDGIAAKVLEMQARARAEKATGPKS